MSSNSPTRCKIRLVIKNKIQQTQNQKRIISKKELFTDNQLHFQTQQHSPTKHIQILNNKLEHISNHCLQLLTQRTSYESVDTKSMLNQMTGVLEDINKAKHKKKQVKKFRSSSATQMKECNRFIQEEYRPQTQNQFRKRVTQIRQIFTQSQQLILLGKKPSFNSCELTRELTSKTIDHHQINKLILTKTKTSRAQTALAPPSKNKTNQIIINKPTSPKHMSFNPIDYEIDYLKRVRSLIQFMYKVNFANRLYVELLLLPIGLPIQTYNIFVGHGNNHPLVLDILKKRFWYQISQKQNGERFDFYWTKHIIEPPILNQDNLQKQLYSNIQMIPFDKTNHLIKPKTISDKTKDLKKKIQLNRNLMNKQQAKIVQQCINEQSHKIMYPPFKPLFITNHMFNCQAITCKKQLLTNLKQYCFDLKESNPYQILPRTFHIQEIGDIEYLYFISHTEHEPDKLWILKHGEISKKGVGLQIIKSKDISQKIINKKHPNGQPITYLIQQYITQPFLYDYLKFHIRHFMLLTSINGNMKGYWFRDGYISTSSQEYDWEQIKNKVIHFTNQTVQRAAPTYEWYDYDNKLSYMQFQRYLDATYPHNKFRFNQKVISKMKEIAKDVINSSYHQMKKEESNGCSFELFALDFIIDQKFKPWLIKVINNPSLKVTCNIVDQVISSLIQQTIRLVVDPLLPPKNHFPPQERHTLNTDYLQQFKFQLIFDQSSV